MILNRTALIVAIDFSYKYDIIVLPVIFIGKKIKGGTAMDGMYRSLFEWELKTRSGVSSIPSRAYALKKKLEKMEPMAVIRFLDEKFYIQGTSTKGFHGGWIGTSDIIEVTRVSDDVLHVVTKSGAPLILRFSECGM